MVRSHYHPQMESLINRIREAVFGKDSNLSGHWTKNSKLTDDENVLAVDLREILDAEKLEGGTGEQTLKVKIEDLEELSKHLSDLDWK